MSARRSRRWWTTTSCGARRRAPASQVSGEAVDHGARDGVAGLAQIWAVAAQEAAESSGGPIEHIRVAAIGNDGVMRVRQRCGEHVVVAVRWRAPTPQTAADDDAWAFEVHTRAAARASSSGRRRRTRGRPARGRPGGSGATPAGPRTRRGSGPRAARRRPRAGVRVPSPRRARPAAWRGDGRPAARPWMPGGAAR